MRLLTHTQTPMAEPLTINKNLISHFKMDVINYTYCDQSYTLLFKGLFTIWIFALWLEGWFNLKMPYYRYRKFHCGDKTILPRSYLHNGTSYTCETTYSCCIRAQCEMGRVNVRCFTCSGPVTIWPIRLGLIIWLLLATIPHGLRTSPVFTLM